jgi:hypothetical protein
MSLISNKSLIRIGLLGIACVWATPSPGAGLCENEGWQCAALSATVGRRTVVSIHDPTHRDDRLLDGGIADISIRAGQMLSLRWQGDGDREAKQKPRVRVSVISNKPAPKDCKEPEWAKETLKGTSDVDLAVCHEGRNFVVTYRVDQGGGKADEKIARIRVHVLSKDVEPDGKGDSDAVTSAAKSQDVPADQEADFSKLGY